MVLLFLSNTTLPTSTVGFRFYDCFHHRQFQSYHFDPLPNRYAILKFQEK